MESERLESQLSKTEELRRELEIECKNLKKEVGTERMSSDKEAYAELEAEYNELLVYLAEVELEQSEGKKNFTKPSTLDELS